jgi:TRAP-type mannitol/chloroaromatic compound transport system permease small subunit
VSILVAFVRVTDRLNDAIGRSIAWLTLAIVLITFTVVVLRYVFSLGWVAMQESYVWLHGVVFMAGAAYTLLHNGHVRVDIFYRSGSARFKAWVDLLGSLFLLLPAVLFVAYVSWDYVLGSWLRLEQSREAGGLPGLFLLKTIIWVFCLFVALQGLSLAARSVLVLRGRGGLVPPLDDGDPAEIGTSGIGDARERDA